MRELVKLQWFITNYEYLDLLGNGNLKSQGNRPPGGIRTPHVMRCVPRGEGGKGIRGGATAQSRVTFFPLPARRAPPAARQLCSHMMSNAEKQERRRGQESKMSPDQAGSGEWEGLRQP